MEDLADMLTAHAAKRMKQRSVPPFILGLLLDYGRVARWRGADSYSFTKHSILEMKADLGKSTAVAAERYLGLYAITEAGRVITVARKH